MDCACGATAVLTRRYEGINLCSDCLCRSVEHTFDRTLRACCLPRGATVAVGLSGGKDSSVLLTLLATAAQNYDFHLVAVIVDEGITGYRDVSAGIAKELAKQLGVRCEIFSFADEFSLAIDDIEQLKQRDEKVKFCTYCGVLRRRALERAARRAGASVLAVGHNLDDEAQTILLNVVRGDLRRMLRADHATSHGIRRIKPLCNIPEREIAAYAFVKNIAHHHGECPHSFDNMRRDVQVMINNLEEKYPGTKHQIVRLGGKLAAGLPRDETAWTTCTGCGEPSSQDVCKACELLTRLEPIRKG